MRLVLDTTVVVAAVRSDRGASRRLLIAALEGRYRLLVSASLLIEHEAVLKGMSSGSRAAPPWTKSMRILNVLARIAEPVEISYLWRPQLADPRDELVLEAAVNGGAGYSPP